MASVCIRALAEAMHPSTGNEWPCEGPLFLAFDGPQSIHGVSRRISMPVAGSMRPSRSRRAYIQGVAAARTASMTSATPDAARPSSTTPISIECSKEAAVTFDEPR